MSDHKRSSSDAGVPGYASSTKVARKELEPPVAAKLESLFSPGLLARTDLDSKIINELAAYDVEDGLRILDQFQAVGLENIRNKSGYLHGVMIRYRRDGTPRLDRDVYARLDKMYRSSNIKAADLDARVFEALATLTPDVAIRTIERFQSRCSDDVRNISAFFMSMLRTEMSNSGPGYRDAPPPPHERAPYGAGPPPRGGGYDPYEHSGGPPPGYADPYGPPRGVPHPPAGMAEPAYAPAPGGYAPAPGFPQQAPVVGKRSFAADQAAMGIRVGEFHGMSVFCEFVHPAPALKLQQLWDGLCPGGPNRLVSLLDDRSWEVLSDLGAPEALAVIDQVADAMGSQELRNPNAFFMSCCKKFHALKTSLHAGAPPEHRGPPPMQRAVPPVGYDGPPARGPPGGYDRGPVGDDYGRGPPQRGGPPPPAPGGRPGGIDLLPEQAKQRAREAIARHYPTVSEATFDGGVCEGIKKLTYGDMMGVFDELINADMGNVRNISAYVMGMIRKRTAGGGGGRGH